jgi:dTMP kinase
MKKGKLIVVDGTDGSGKATQVALLKERLIKEGYQVETIDFPRYEDNFFGKLIGECLAGKHGDFISVHSKIVSVLYSADRWQSSDMIRDWLSQGKIVIADRYVSANQIHQGGKIHDDKEREEFLLWLDKLEYEVFKLPRPDHTVYLDVSLETTLRLLKEKDQVFKKKYSEGVNDQAENNHEHLVDSRESAIKMLQNTNWTRIACEEEGQMLPREVITEKIYNVCLRILSEVRPIKIYFAGSIRGGRNDHELYAKIITLLKKYGTVLTEHVGDKNLTNQGQKNLTNEEIHTKDIGWIDEADIIVAEVTSPSLGVGYEIGRAEPGGKKIIALYRQEEERKLSAMIAGNKNVQTVYYQDVEELVEIFDKLF